MADLIDRQAAIDAIMGQPPEPHYPSWYAAQIEILPSAQPEILACGEGELNAPDTNVGDMISRQAAIDALARMMPRSYTPDGSHPADEEIFKAQEVYADCIKTIELLPAVQPDRAIIDDCLHHIYKNISVHTATGGVITIKHYMQVLYEEIYGEGERPWWMT